MDDYPVKINYIDNTWKENEAKTDVFGKKFKELAACVEKEIKDNQGFVKLIYRSEGIWKNFYYNYKINAILGDMQSFSWENPRISGHFLTLQNDKKHLLIQNIAMGVLSKDEFQMIFTDRKFRELYEKCSQTSFLDKCFAVVAPVSLLKIANSEVYREEELENKSIQAYSIPVYRCKDEVGLDAQPDIWRLTDVFLKKGFYPCCVWDEKPVLEQEFLSVWSKWMKEQNESEIAGNCGEDSRGINILKADDEDIEKIKDYYCNRLPKLTAMLPEYERNIFQMNTGSWDLWQFADLTKDKLYGTGHFWYDVSDYNLYARNPCMDIASDIEVAAIDFGTKSTTVGVYDNQGNITLIPVGGWEMLLSDEKRFENPTILRFTHVDRFLKQYQSVESCRLDTRFDDIAVSHHAEQDYEKWDTKKNMFQYQDHLKQWVNAPEQKIRICDNDGRIYILCSDNKSDDGIDPIEIYAYYIGLYLNNMKTKKVYLKYLLSYSATYTHAGCEQIRKSFERGLKKSLPKEIYSDTEVMKRFEVKLWRDEAAAYAICAVDTYLNQKVATEEREKIIKCSDNGGFFYGVYDFGGGTLDFSFGYYKDENEIQFFDTRGTGGSSSLGCENILEELAFHIFYENQKVLNQKKIRCRKPFHMKSADGGQVTSDSQEAARNTKQMINILKKCWMQKDEKKDDTSEEFLTFKLMSEDGEEYNVGEDIIQILDRKKIEQFFVDSIKTGVDLFFNKYKEINKDSEYKDVKKTAIFLAGNASRSPRVTECFNQYLKENKKEEQFYLINVLSEEQNEKYEIETKGVPTAKTGVVYGLLLSRPGAEFIRVDSGNEKKAECPDFLYHIGYKTINKEDKGWRFCLAVHAGEMPLCNEKYRKLRKIPQQIFELLYTSDYRYAVKDSPLGKGIYAVQITVPEWAVDQYLFCRAKPESVHEIELGVSSSDDCETQNVTVVGCCDFSASGSVFKAGITTETDSAVQDNQAVTYKWQRT